MPNMKKHLTIEVTSHKDGNEEGTLRWAIHEANNQAAADPSAIVINLSRVSDVIVLKRALPVIRANVTLRGKASKSTISGAGRFRCLAIDDHAASVVIEGLRLVDGLAQGIRGEGSKGGSAGMGGGLFINASTEVRLKRVHFSNNSAIGGRGGAASPFAVALEPHEEPDQATVDNKTHKTEYSQLRYQATGEQQAFDADSASNNQDNTPYSDSYGDEKSVSSSMTNRGSVSDVSGEAISGIGAIAFGGGGGFGGFANGGNGGNGGSGGGDGGNGGDGGKAHFGAFQSTLNNPTLDNSMAHQDDPAEIYYSVNRGSLAGLQGKANGGIGAIGFAGGGGFGGFSNGGNGGNGGNLAELDSGKKLTSKDKKSRGCGGHGGNGGEGSFCNFSAAEYSLLESSFSAAETQQQDETKTVIAQRGALSNQEGVTQRGTGSVGFSGGGGFGGFGNGANGGNGSNGRTDLNQSQDAAHGGNGGNGGNGGFGGGGGGGASGGAGGVLFMMRAIDDAHPDISGVQSGGTGSPGQGGWGAGAGGLDFGGGGGGFGGAVFIRQGNLVVEDCSFEGNKASGGKGTNRGQGKGGAVFAIPSELRASVGDIAVVSIKWIGFNPMSNSEASDAGRSETDNSDVFFQAASFQEESTAIRKSMVDTKKRQKRVKPLLSAKPHLTVLAAIRRRRKGIDIATLKEITGIDGKAMTRIIQKLKRDGMIKSASRGVYSRVT